MTIDWTKVRRKHVRKACEKYDKDPNLRPVRPAKNTFLLFNNNKYPAKFIRGMAYQVVTGETLNPSIDYSGGKETVRFFAKLGFNTAHNGKVLNENLSHTKKRIDVNRKNMTKLNAKKQKVALKKLLEKCYGKVETEVGFSWLKVPKKKSLDTEIGKIVSALTKYRDYKKYFSPGKSLKCDFYIPSINTIIEYDERQHFTIPREISLNNYPPGLKVGFDKEKWQLICLQTRAIDSSPEYRDEQRALYDSLRDILSARNKVKLIRLEHGKIDWETKVDERVLNSIVDPVANKFNLRVGRVVLDFGKSCGEWRKLKEEKGWEYRLKIIDSYYRKNASDYRKRIKNVLDICVDHECDIVVLPACTFIYENNKDVSYYKRSCKNIPLVISGFLKQNTKRESAEIMQFGNSVEKVNGSVAVHDTGSHTILAAISSNITKIYRDHNESMKEELKQRIKTNSPVLIFMLGHQQYVSNRIKMRLDKVRREIKELTKRKNTIIVPYWKWPNSKGKYEFYEPHLRWIKCKSANKKIEDNYGQYSDHVDILDIKL